MYRFLRLNGNLLRLSFLLTALCLYASHSWYYLLIYRTLCDNVIRWFLTYAIKFMRFVSLLLILHNFVIFPIFRHLWEYMLFSDAAIFWSLSIQCFGILRGTYSCNSRYIGLSILFGVPYILYCTFLRRIFVSLCSDILFSWFLLEYWHKLRTCRCSI